MSIHRLDALFLDYGTYHKAAWNKMLHRIGIPLIVFSLLGMLARASVVVGSLRIDAAGVLIALAFLFYLSLDTLLAFATFAGAVLFYLSARELPLAANVMLFLGGWILQFIGHALFERRSPAFLRNGVHLLVGPLWIIDEVTGRSRRRRSKAGEKVAHEVSGPRPAHP